MRSVIILIASLAIIVLGVWGTAVIYLDEDRLKGMLSAQVEQQTGRKLEIQGSLKLRLFPRLRLDAERIVLASPEGFDGPDLLEADFLSASVRLLPLMRGNLTAGDVQVRGATVNLHTNRSGQTTLDGINRVSMGEALEARARLLSTRQMRLEDVRIRIDDLVTGDESLLEVDFIELDRFRLDRMMQFTFRGNVGEPPIFSSMSVDGLLFVPSTRQSPLRLTNMRLVGELAGSQLPMTLTGDVAFSATAPLDARLANGRLNLAGEAFNIDADYAGGDRAHLRLVAAGTRVDLAAGSGPYLPDWALAAVPFARGTDMDVQLSLSELETARLRLESPVLTLTARGSNVSLGLSAGMPGGVTEAVAQLQLDAADPAATTSVRMDIAELDTFLSSLGAPPVLTGSGQVELAMQFPMTQVNGSASSTDGQFEFFDGDWIFGETSDDSGGQVHFDRLHGRFRLLPGHIDFPEIELQGDAGHMVGWVAVSLVEELLGGQLILVEDGREVSLSGSLRRPDFSPPLASPDATAQSIPANSQ